VEYIVSSENGTIVRWTQTFDHLI